MTDQEKIDKLKQVIEEAVVAFKMLPELNGCRICTDRNQEVINKITAQIELFAGLKKEIV